MNAPGTAPAPITQDRPPSKALVVLLSLWLPPLGIAYAWRRKLWGEWSRTFRVVLSAYAVLWAITVVGISHQSESGNQSGLPVRNADRLAAIKARALARENAERNPSTRAQMRAEAVVFKRYLDEAVEIKSRMTELEDEVHQGSRHEQPMAAGEFHQRSREFSKRIDALKGQFDKKFGASLNEYPGGFNNPNHRLYLNTAGALSALRAVWLDWHHSILGDQPSAKGDLASSEEQFWNDTNAALERIEQLKGPPPDAKNSTSKDS